MFVHDIYVIFKIWLLFIALLVKIQLYITSSLAPSQISRFQILSSQKVPLLGNKYNNPVYQNITFSGQIFYWLVYFFKHIIIVIIQ